MPLSIQIPYRGDAYLYGGISSLGDTVGEGILRMTQNMRAAKAYRAMAVDALGMDPDEVDKMGLGELQGHVQAEGMKSAMQQHAALAAQEQAKAALLQSDVDTQTALPEMFRNIMALRAGQGAGPGAGGPMFNPDVMSPGASQAGSDAMMGPVAPAAGGVGPGGPGGLGGGAGPITPDEIMGGIASMSRTNPKLGAALVRSFIPQLMKPGGSLTPEFFKSPEGSEFVRYGNTILPTHPPIDINSLPALPGYMAVPGKGGPQYLKTPEPKSLPPTFNSTMDSLTQQINQHRATLNSPDDDTTLFTDAKDAKSKKARAQRALSVAQATAKQTIDRYHSAGGYLTDEQRDNMYQDLGLGGGSAAPAKPAAAAPQPAKGSRVSIYKDGKVYNVPVGQLDDFKKLGFTERE